MAKNRGDFAAALALCRRGGRHHRDERMAYLAASILALEGDVAEAAELLALAVGQNARNRVLAFHDSDFADVLNRRRVRFRPRSLLTRAAPRDPRPIDGP